MIVAAAREVLVVRSGKIAEALARDFEDARGERGNERAIVRDEHERALELEQRRDERLDRFEIEMVRRLVEHEHVGFLRHDAAEDQPRGFAAGERAHLLVHVVAREEDATELRHGSRSVLRRQGVGDDSSGVAAGIEQELAMVLRKVADVRLVAPVDLAGVRRDVLGRNLEQRRLAEAVRTDDRDALAAADEQRDVAEHQLRAVGFSDVGEREHVSAARSRGEEAKLRRAARARFELLDFDLSICLRRLCACRALVALAPKRSTQARFSAIVASARAISASFCARSSAFCRAKAL